MHDLNEQPTPSDDAASVLGVKAVCTFQPRPEWAWGAEIRDFLTRNASKDIYFLLGEPKGRLNKKPRKDDMAGSKRLWVDLDPPPSVWDKAKQETAPGALKKWRSEALAALTSFVPAPTFLIDSGRGYWGLWQLDALASQDDAEAANIALARAFGGDGDSCHNIDRVARMPGTRNSKTGTIAALAVSKPSRVYSIDQFPKINETARPTAVSSRAACSRSAKLPANPSRIDDIAGLDAFNVPAMVCTIIQHGSDPERPDRFASRSESVFYVCCELCRCQVPHDIILGILLDKRFVISDSIYRKRSGALVPNPEEYARRQVTKAQSKVDEDVSNSQLGNLNSKHAVLLQEGGKTRVLSWEWSELDFGREVPVLQSFEDFRNRYMNQTVPIKTNRIVKLEPLGKWWLQHRMRRQYTALRFLPGQPKEVDGYLNLWRGYSVAPQAGSWARMRGHVQDVLAAGVAAYAEYILQWAAWTVQHPDEPAEVALVLKGRRGTGKGTFARAMKRLFGQHGLHVTSPMQLTGRFNAHLRDCCLLFADEAIAPGDKAAESVLKGLITEPELTIEGKGVDAIQARNRLHIIMASNESWVVPAGVDERRFAVFEVSNAVAQNEGYFAAIEAEIRDGGFAAMLHDLLAIDLGDWHPRQEVPQTEALKEQQALSLGGFEGIFLDLLGAGQIPTRREVGPGQPFVATIDLCNYARARLRRDVTYNAVSKLLRELGSERPNGRPRGFAFPTLPEARKAWDRVKAPVPWDDTSEWADIDEEPL